MLRVYIVIIIIIPILTARHLQWTQTLVVCYAVPKYLFCQILRVINTFLLINLKTLISVGMTEDFWDEDDEDETIGVRLINFETNKWIRMKNFPAFPAVMQSDTGTLVVNGVLYVAGGAICKYY